MNFGYLSDPLHDVIISSICLAEVEEWGTGAVSGARLKMTIKPPEHCIDVVLMFFVGSD